MKSTEIYEPSLDAEKREGKEGSKEVFRLLFSGRKDLDLGNEFIDDLLKGMIDFHIHAAPCAFSERIYDEEDIAIRACEAGMKAVVFKCHSAPSSNRKFFVEKSVNTWAKARGKEPVDVFGGVVLNYPVGGLNPHAVQTSIRLGGKFVWTPSVDAAHHRRVLGKAGGIEVTTESGEIVPALKEIFEIVRKEGAILGLSHHSVRERFLLIEEARKFGIEKIIVNHPLGDINKATPEQIQEMAEMGAYILVTYVTSVPNFWCPTASLSETLEVLKRVGFDRIVGGTELTQIGNPHPTDGIKFFLKILLFLGVTEEDLRTMFTRTPSKILYN